MKEFCIMPESYLYKTERQDGLVRHEIFFGNKNRTKSIYYGLIIYLTPKMHNMSNHGVHFDNEFDLELKRRGQLAAMEYYGWDIEKFIEVFGRNYINDVDF